MSTFTEESLKQKAKLIHNFISEKYKVDVSHGHCLELISQIFGFKDWNTASAALNLKTKKDILPIHVRTVGDMKKALALFDDDDAIFDGEYEFKLNDFLSDIDPDLEDIDSTIIQEFSLILTDFVPDIASFKLKLEHESAGFDNPKYVS